jgi:hypothetical protein
MERHSHAVALAKAWGVCFQDNRPTGGHSSLTLPPTLRQFHYAFVAGEYPELIDRSVITGEKLAKMVGCDSGQVQLFSRYEEIEIAGTGWYGDRIYFNVATLDRTLGQIRILLVAQRAA